MEIILSYLIGAIPTAYIFGRLKGLDLHQYGSGNIGATNAWRVLGKRIGLITLCLDILKGVIIVVLLAQYFPIRLIDSDILRKIFCGLAAIIGHNFPVYLKFRGGKGVAVSAGVFLGLAPKMMGLAAVLWGFVFLITGYVSLASILAGVSLPFLSLWLNYPKEMHWFCLGLGPLILIQHRDNLKRLKQGKEKRFFKKNIDKEMRV